MSIYKIFRNSLYQPLSVHIQRNSSIVITSLTQHINVTVNFIAEIITCIKDKDKKIVSGDPEKIKKIYDTWVFSRDTTSINPNWKLVNILT